MKEIKEDCEDMKRMLSVLKAKAKKGTGIENTSALYSRAFILKSML